MADWFGCGFGGSSRGGPAAGLGFDSQPPLRLFPGVLRFLGGLAAYSSGVRGEPFCYEFVRNFFGERVKCKPPPIRCIFDWPISTRINTINELCFVAAQDAAHLNF